MAVLNESIPAKTDAGIKQLTQKTIGLPIRIRQLFVLINGKKSVGELLRLGFSDLDISVFQELLNSDLIYFPEESGRKEQQNSLEAGIGFSECRYDVIEVLLDHLGVASRDIIVKVELTKNMSELKNLVNELLGTTTLRLDTKIKNALLHAADLPVVEYKE